MAGLHCLDPPQGEDVREVDEPELELVDLQPGMRVLAADIVHGLAERFDDSLQFALAAGDQPPWPTHAVPSLGQPAFSCAPAPRTQHVFGLSAVDGLERLVQAP